LRAKEARSQEILPVFGTLLSIRYCNTLQHTATHCITLQHTATHCNTLHHTATHCNTMARSQEILRVSVTSLSTISKFSKVLYKFSGTNSLVQLLKSQLAAQFSVQNNYNYSSALPPHSLPTCIQSIYSKNSQMSALQTFSLVNLSVGWLRLVGSLKL